MMPLAWGWSDFRSTWPPDAFEEFMEEGARTLLEAVADEPVAGLLTPAREAALAETVEGWLEGAVESEGFEGTVEDYVERATENPPGARQEPSRRSFPWVWLARWKRPSHPTCLWP